MSQLKPLADLCEELSLWHNDIPGVVLHTLQRLTNGLQDMSQRVGLLATTCRKCGEAS